MSGPIAPLETSLVVAATPDKVWSVLKDQTRMRAWSPETLVQFFYPRRLSHGQISINVNRRKWFIWPTASRYVDVARPHRLAFFVYGPAARWSYRLDAEGTGTRLTLRRDLKRGRRTLLSRIVASLALGGIEEHDDELVDGMNRTLRAIEAEVAANAA